MLHFSFFTCISFLKNISEPLQGAVQNFNKQLYLIVRLESTDLGVKLWINSQLKRKVHWNKRSKVVAAWSKSSVKIRMVIFQR